MQRGCAWWNTFEHPTSGAGAPRSASLRLVGTRSVSEDRSSQVKSAEDLPARGDPLSPGDERSDAARSGSEAPPHSTTSPPSGPPAIDSQKTVISKRPPVSPPAFRKAANPFEMGEALEGEQLGHFQLEEFVGGGGMGAVFRATDTMLGRTVAVKVVSHDQTNEDTLRRFKNEAQSAARLDHPNIARVYYVGVDKGWNYIVFEYIEGINVRDLVDHHGPLTLEDAISYTLQIAEALEHASQRDVTHRDIKPSNILIMADGRAKLVDMGLARLQQVESSTDDLTASGVTLGTFDYISPEQARDPRNTDVRSDLYSLGCTLFFMLTGQPPFPEGTVLQKLLSHSGDNPPDLRDYRPDIDEEVALVVDRLLAKQPDQRYQRPRELIGALLLIVDRLDLSGIRTQSTVWYTHTEQSPTWWRRHIPWIVAVVCLLLFVLAFGWIDAGGAAPLGTVPQLPASPYSGSSSAASRGTEPQKMVATGDRAERSTEADNSSDSNTPVTIDSAPAEPKTETEATDEVPKREAPKTTAKVESEADEEGDQGATGTDRSETSTDSVTDPPEASPAVKPDTLEAVQDPPDSLGAATPPALDEERTELVIVTDDPVGDDSDATYVTSLQQAIEYVTTLGTAADIELQLDGLQMLKPLVIDTDQLPDNRLTIRAARGFSPVLAFRPTAGPGGYVSAQSMIDIIGGQVSFRGIHFYLEMPDTAQPVECRSLLRLDSTDRTEFRECTFTLRNIGLDETDQGRQVAFVDVVGPGGITGLLFESRPLGGDAPTIWLKDCIARGQAPFVRADFAVPFFLAWEHGLFISTDRLVEVGGTNFEPRWEHGVVNVFLQSLLCVADKGICLVRSDYVAPYQLGVVVQCDDCLFATKPSKPPVPLYVVRTGSGFSQNGHSLKIRGSRNYYKNTQLVLQTESAPDRNIIEQFVFDDLTVADPPSWYAEENPEPAVDAIFSWDPPTETVDRQTTGDFIPPSISDGWFTRALALAPSQLPRLPDIPNLLEGLSDTDEADSRSRDDSSAFRPSAGVDAPLDRGTSDGDDQW